MKHKTLTRSGFCFFCIAACTTGALAGESTSNLTANLTFTSDYVFRGISQSQNGPAVQGGIDWTSDRFYAGVWASSIDFGGGAPSEIDIYAGFAPTLGTVDLNFGAIYYAYPKANDPASGEFNYFELNAGARRDFGSATVNLALNYSPDYFGESGNALFFEGSIGVRLGRNFELSSAVGHQWIENNAAFGTPDYLTWNVGVGYTWEQFTLDLRYHDTNLSRTQCFGGGPGADVCSARAVLSITANF